MDKSELRSFAINKLKNIDEHEKKIIEENLTTKLTGSDLWKQANTIGITISKGFEWETKTIIEQGWAAGKTIAVPKCLPESKEMQFYSFTDYSELEVVYYNLLEPKPESNKEINSNEIDLLIVPGLLFDKKGYRIGFGGGYYDRYLVNYPNVTISLAFHEQLLDSIPTEPFDIPVQYIVTNEQIVECWN
ncbi:5-formyltetrahydrofolate cyclo-ligase [Ornithinibacillus halophilus]|uniref:5-formyltetrahydrofolate cyclo-ligase n=1 Tax=Ornithinibacillus halophilus TaxID=930117 RepID=A0A1M5D2U4_9BACI|nr:5-formyltetrahydrofolate cyclo-ligase [Ornithinibacillus halophilus]SHF61112.1 5-formyltetrahydrofolate cyclo-ligase [Ornithinibacillus halophilus]